MSSSSENTPIVIVGAGPSGAATALRLSSLGIPSVLIDQSEFPRDKVCGDALSGKVPVLLDRMNPAIMDRFRQKYKPIDVWGIRFFPPSGIKVELPFKVDYTRIPDEAPGYVSKRIDFDNFLIEEVRRCSDITLHTGVKVADYKKITNGYRIQSSDGSMAWDCNLLIDASGAHSAFSRHHANIKTEKNHHAAAVRAYYQGVTGFHKDNFIELHFLKEYNPGYFWIFPLPNGQANIGLGMRSDKVSRRKLNLRKELDRIVASDAFKERFKDAKPIGKTEGYGLPLGSRKISLSGDNYLLTGDAGHLIDPLTGEGIGNGIYSGIIAAEIAQKCLDDNRFDADYLKDYDIRIARVLGAEFQLSTQLQRIMAYTRLTNFLTSFINKNPKTIKLLTLAYTDLEIRKRLVKPEFWWKIIRGKDIKPSSPQS